MKHFNLLIVAAAFVMLFGACKEINDIVDADKNVKITKIELGEIRDNQETGVIMPLKEGNIWYYKVTDYDNAGNILRTFNTSVKVKGEKIIDNEKWFEVQFPMISEKFPVYMINTEDGLYSQSPDNPEFIGSTNLTAKYPEINNTFYSGFLVDTINTTSDLLDTSSIWYQSSNQNVTVPKGNYNCIKYAGNFKSQKANLEGKPYMNTYFMPDFGLVKAEIYPYGAEYIRRVYELIENPQADPTVGCVHSETLDIGDLKAGKTFKISRSIENNGLNEYKLEGIAVTPGSAADIISFSNINPSTSSWLSNNLKPGQTLSFDITVHPVKSGEFKAKVMFLYKVENTNNEYNCWYGIDITGNCTD